jgi:ammonia channel protein AmtB
MKNIFWKVAMVFSVITMIAGFAVSLHGINNQNYDTIYIGMVIIGVTCVSWWIWVMSVIKAMWDFTQSTVNKVQEIRLGVREVRKLFEEYKKLSDR